MTINAPNASTPSIELGQGLLRKLVLGAGLAATIALYVYELISRNPAESFGLLRQFGSGFLISVIALLLFWDLLKLGVGYVGKLADGVQTLSAAVTTIAEKDDRQAEEIQRIAQFNAQNGERMLIILQEQGNQLKGISERLNQMGTKT